MPNFNLSITIKILDKWEGLNSKWNYVVYILCEIADNLYLLEKEI